MSDKKLAQLLNEQQSIAAELNQLDESVRNVQKALEALEVLGKKTK